MSEGPSSPEQRSPEPQRPVEAPQPRPAAESSEPVIPSSTLAEADAARSQKRLTGVR